MDEKEVWERIASVEAKAKSAHHRLDRLESITDSIHSLATEMCAMRTDFNNILERVQTIEQRPQKRYDVFVTTAITAFTSGIIGFMLSKIFI